MSGVRAAQTDLSVARAPHAGGARDLSACCVAPCVTTTPYTGVTALCT